MAPNRADPLRLAGVGLALGLGIAAAAGPISACAQDAVIVSSKIDTEGALLGNLIAIVLERHHLPVKNRIQLGPTEIVRAALLAGQIDIYPEYTGNGARFLKLEGDPVWRDPDRGYRKVRDLDLERNRLVWLTPSPADNTWAIAVRKDFAAAHGLAALSDFSRYVVSGGAVKLAASAEFVNSAGALPAFEAAYGFKLRRSQLLVLVGGDTAATIRAAAEGTSGVNASMAYGTDGALPVLGLLLLRDDKRVQIVYRPAPVVREPVLRRHPDIALLLGPVFGSLSLEVLQELNARIAVEGMDPRLVAADYLAAKGFDR